MGERRDWIFGSVDKTLNSVARSHSDLEGSEPFFRRSADPDNQSKHEPKTWSRLLIVTAVTATIGSVIPGGYNIGILNSPQQIIVEFCNASLWHNYGIVVEEAPLQLLWSFVVSIFLIGGGIGAILAGPIANTIGRKNALLVINLLNVIASVLFGTCGLAKSVEMLLLGRLIVGLGAGASTSFLPLYISEISTAGARNILGLFCPVGINLGLFIGQVLSLEKVLGNEGSWNLLLALTCFPALVCMAIWYFLPESPRFLLVTRKRQDLARKELCRLRGSDNEATKAELDAMLGGDALLSPGKNVIVEKKSANESEKWSLKKIFTTKNLRWPVICVIVMHLGNQFSGINAVMYYSTSIFLSAGLDKLQAELAILGAGFVNFVMTAMVAVLTSRFPRRTLMFISTIGVGTFLIILAITISFISEAAWVAYICIASLLLYVVVFDVGVGPLPFFLPTELIPPGPQPLVMSFGCMMNWSANFLVGMTFPTLQNAIGVYSFAVFAAATYAQSIFLYFKLPETFRA